MMCWIIYSSERNMIPLIRKALLPYNRLTVSCVHTSLSLIDKLDAKGSQPNSENGKLDAKGSRPNTENGKLDAFVHSIKLKSSRSAKVRKNSQTSGCSQKLTEVSKNVVPDKTIEVKTNDQASMNGHILSKTDTVSRVSLEKRQQSLSTKIDLQKKDVIVVDSVISKSSQEKLKIESQSDQGNFIHQNMVANYSSLYNEMKPNHSKQMNNRNVSVSNVYPTQESTTEEQSKLRLEKETVKTPSNRLKRRKRGKQAYLKKLIYSGKADEALAEIESCVRLSGQNLFGLFHCFCGAACTFGLVDEVVRIKQLAEACHPGLYRQQLCFDNYLASALCYSGDFSNSLETLMSLYEKCLHNSRPLKDATTLTIFHIMKNNVVENEEMVFKFVNDLAAKQNRLKPALTFWRIAFTSTLYRQQKKAEGLLESYPELLKMLPVKLDNLIHTAYLDGDIEQLHRIFELLLKYQFTDHYATATNSLLQYQCDTGDLAGANQTIKFAHTFRITLKPSIIERVLVVLYHQSVPAPSLLLDMKYSLPRKPLIQRPPEFQYKF